MRTPELETAFRATTYRVETEGQAFDLKVDLPDPAFASWLKSQSAPCWGIVTACNPRGALAADNEARTKRLQEEIEERGWSHVPAVNRADAANWPDEPGFCVLGVQTTELRMLAAAFDQSAIVVGGSDGAGAILWIEGS